MHSSQTRDTAQSKNGGALRQYDGRGERGHHRHPQGAPLDAQQTPRADRRVARPVCVSLSAPQLLQVPPTMTSSMKRSLASVCFYVYFYFCLLSNINFCLNAARWRHSASAAIEALHFIFKLNAWRNYYISKFYNYSKLSQSFVLLSTLFMSDS